MEAAVKSTTQVFHLGTGSEAAVESKGEDVLNDVPNVGKKSTLAKQNTKGKAVTVQRLYGPCGN